MLTITDFISRIPRLESLVGDDLGPKHLIHDRQLLDKQLILNQQTYQKSIFMTYF